jgi:hypothetical protein
MFPDTENSFRGQPNNLYGRRKQFMDAQIIFPDAENGSGHSNNCPWHLYDFFFRFWGGYQKSRKCSPYGQFFLEGWKVAQFSVFLPGCQRAHAQTARVPPQTSIPPAFEARSRYRLKKSAGSCPPALPTRVSRK